MDAWGRLGHPEKYIYAGREWSGLFTPCIDIFWRRWDGCGRDNTHTKANAVCASLAHCEVSTS